MTMDSSRVPESEMRRAADRFVVEQYAQAKDKNQNARDHAWEELQRQFTPLVRECVRACLKNQADDGKIDDLVQETFISAFKSFDHFDLSLNGTFASWLKTIAKQRAIDASRSTVGRKGTNNYQKREMLAINPLLDDERSANLSTDETPESAMMDAEQQKIILLAMNGLDDREQRMVIMRNILGINNKEISVVLGFTESRGSQIFKIIDEKLSKTLERKNGKPMDQDSYNALIQRVHAQVQATTEIPADEQQASAK